ncbi:MAG: hypothetical protein ACD_57C00021G0001 [uncultured bacterium]|nr:MAG: hypothetical protein ACD_57C00021G0001 [uncultured bacterium]
MPPIITPARNAPSVMVKPSHTERVTEAITQTINPRIIISIELVLSKPDRKILPILRPKRTTNRKIAAVLSINIKIDPAEKVLPARSGRKKKKGTINIS